MEHCTDTHFPLTRIQKLIGKRMLNSKLSKPCFYVQSRADIEEILTFRRKLSRKLGVKITTNTFFLRALALSARDYPMVLATLSDDRFTIPPRINVGFAVNAPQGVIVPVVKDADNKSLAEIAVEEERLTLLARSNEIDLVDMEGETLALSNLGAYDMDSFAGIVPPPASVIMSVGNVLREVVCRDAKPTPTRRISLTLTADRRVIDEPLAARFLCDIARRIEDPHHLADKDLPGR